GCHRGAEVVKRSGTLPQGISRFFLLDEGLFVGFGSDRADQFGKCTLRLVNKERDRLCLMIVLFNANCRTGAARPRAKLRTALSSDFFRLRICRERKDRLATSPPDFVVSNPFA